MTTKKDLHQLVDALPDEAASAAAQGLQALATMSKRRDIQQLAAALRTHFDFGQLSELVAWLQEGLTPVERSLLCAPFDDEPTSQEEEAVVAEARRELAAGKGRDLAAVRADLARRGA